MNDIMDKEKQFKERFPELSKHIQHSPIVYAAYCVYIQESISLDEFFELVIIELIRINKENTDAISRIFTLLPMQYNPFEKVSKPID